MKKRISFTLSMLGASAFKLSAIYLAVKAATSGEIMVDFLLYAVALDTIAFYLMGVAIGHKSRK